MSCKDYCNESHDLQDPMFHPTFHRSMSQTGWIQLGLIFIPTNGWPGSGSWIRGWRCLCQRHRGVFVFKQGTPWEGKRHGGLVGSDSPAGWYLHVATGRSNCSMEDGEETNKPVSFGRAFVSKVMKHVKGLLVYLILGLLKIPTASLEESTDHCIFSKETTWSFNSICFPGDLWYRNHLVVVSGGFKNVYCSLQHWDMILFEYIYIYIYLTLVFQLCWRHDLHHCAIERFESLFPTIVATCKTLCKHYLVPWSYDIISHQCWCLRKDKRLSNTSH